jgi:hypothetical protein
MKGGSLCRVVMEQVRLEAVDGDSAAWVEPTPLVQTVTASARNVDIGHRIRPDSRATRRPVRSAVPA